MDLGIKFASPPTEFQGYINDFTAGNIYQKMGPEYGMESVLGSN